MFKKAFVNQQRRVKQYNRKYQEVEE